jgi:NitT/TauT family transport system permease protein
MKLQNTFWFAPTFFWIGVLLIWEWGANTGWIARLFFPAPSVILAVFARQIANGELLIALGYTLARLGLGLMLGALPGLLLGLVMGWSRAVRVVAEPVVAALHPLPKLALLPLVLVIFGIGEQSKIVMIALVAFFPMLINSMSGVQQIDSQTWEVARHYNARGWILLRRVILPGSLPMILAGAKLAVNVALLITVTVEMVTARQGLGATIWLAWQTLRTENLYAALIVIASLGLLTNWILDQLTARWIPWQSDHATR